MFYRLINNLQYSPGLLNQVTFYAKRLKREEFVRRLGLIFSILALTLQAFLFLSPSEPSLASSQNDIIFGGGNKTRIVNAYTENKDDLGRTDIKAVFDRFGIGETELRAAKDVKIQSRAENDFYSIGRFSRFSSDIERKITIPNEDPVYIRPLHAWDSGAYSTYDALYGVTKDGEEFWVLKNCGNIVIKGPTVDPLPPTLEIDKKVTSPVDKIVEPGEEIDYEIYYRNVGPGDAVFMSVTDLIPEHTSFVSASGSKYSITNGQIKFSNLDEKTNPYGILGITDHYHTISLKLKVKDGTPSGTKICNIANINAINGDSSSSKAKSACVTVEVPVVIEESPEEPEPTPDPIAKCVSLTAEQLSRNSFNFKAEGKVDNGATISSFVIDFGDQTSQEINNDNNNIVSIEHTYANPGEYTIRATLKTSEGDKTANTCVQTVTVAQEVVEEGEPKLTYNKLVSNITQSIEDANGAMAQAGDVLEYKLLSKNFGDGEAVEFNLPKEDVADLLEYADITELNDAIFDKQDKSLTWPTLTIKPGETITKTFTVKVKNPIPQTPVSTSDAGSFDLTISNSYGNDFVEIKLPPATGKRIETVAQNLPETGVGDSAITSTFLIGLSTYFYSRNRIITKELKLVRKEFA